jgi:hypothetical protein
MPQDRTSHSFTPEVRPGSAHRAGLTGVLDSIIAAQHVLEMFRRSLPPSHARKHLDRLSNRLTKILAEARQLAKP